jgi:hypothetical protein
MTREAGSREVTTKTAIDVPAFEAIVRSEFNEMPGIRLTMPQAALLWGLPPVEARLLIGALVERGTLAFDERGRVCRPQDLYN